MAVMGTYRDRPREAGSGALRSLTSPTPQGFLCQVVQKSREKAVDSRALPSRRSKSVRPRLSNGRPDHSNATLSVCERAHLVETPPPDAITLKYNSAEPSQGGSEFSSVLRDTMACRPKVLGPIWRSAGPS